MKFLFTVLVMLVLASQAFAGVLYERTVVPRDWTMLAASPANAEVKFIIALKQRNLEQLDAKFWGVSDPEHVDFQNFWSTEQIASLVAPEPAVTTLVTSWLTTHGVDNIKSYGDAIEVKTTVHRAESLFSTKYYTFVHNPSGKKLNKAFGAFSVPDNVHSVIDFVEGVSTFPMPKFQPKRAKTKSPDQNEEIAVPQFTALQYSIPALKAGSNPDTTQGVIEYEDEFFSNNDTSAFNAATDWIDPLIATSNIVGTNDPTEPGDESSLDVQWQAAINPTATPWFWIEGGDTWLYGFAVHFLNTTTVPQVTSTSYGWWEGDQCEDGIGGSECTNLGVNSTGYVIRVNTEFQKIGVAGSSLVVASGDSGANGRTNGLCTIPQLRPAFPASSPYVTSVGATEIRSPVYNLTSPPPICSGQGFSCVGGGIEAAVSVNFSYYASGGGFSNISIQPSYQTSVVQAYLSSGVKLPPSSYYNAAGRALPDVSALGQNAYVVIGGYGTPVSGTSMSSPIFSGIASLLNAEAIKISGKPLGFLNPTLYSIYASNPSAFNDITLGDNICTEDGCSTGCQGFYATKGWDPVTGLGTPNYAQLLKSVQDLFARRKAKGLM